MLRTLSGLVLALALASCTATHAPSAAYGDALRACDAKPSEIEWIECCVKAAQSYNQDPNFCFQ